MFLIWKNEKKKMSRMGQNSGAELCAFYQTGRHMDELDAKTRSIQNWELNSLQIQ